MSNFNNFSIFFWARITRVLVASHPQDSRLPWRAFLVPCEKETCPDCWGCQRLLLPENSVPEQPSTCHCHSAKPSSTLEVFPWSHRFPTAPKWWSHGEVYALPSKDKVLIQMDDWPPVPAFTEGFCFYKRGTGILLGPPVSCSLLTQETFLLAPIQATSHNHHVINMAPRALPVSPLPSSL